MYIQRRNRLYNTFVETATQVGQSGLVCWCCGEQLACDISSVCSKRIKAIQVDMVLRFTGKVLASEMI